MVGGEPSVHFINSVLVTAVVAPFVLWRYRRAILRGMGRGDGAALPLPAVGDRQRIGAGDLRERERSMRRLTAMVWLLTTFLCGLPMALAYAWAANYGFPPVYTLALASCTMIAALPMIATSLALPPSRLAAAFAAMVATFAALFLAAGIVQRALAGRPLEWRILGLVPLYFEIAWNLLWMAGLFWALSWPARMRGVVPITFAAVLVFGLAPFAGSRLTAMLAATEIGTPWVMALGLDGVFVLIALPVGWLAWRRLHRLARDYEAKRFSDAQLLARTWWLMLAVTIGFDILIGRNRPDLAVPLTLAEIVGFGAVNQGVTRMFGLAQRAQAGPSPTLLLLRVFGYTARTERLFDRVAARWRLLGPVTMIAAPDVTARTIDAGDYLRWLTGRVDDLFVTSATGLADRLARLDLRPDPDGRFRVNEFCCRASTWQACVVELMLRADVVLMDLRGVTSSNRGCEFELQQLSRRLPPQRIVLVVDDTTDKAVLRAAFGPALQQTRLIEVRRPWQADRAFASLLDAAS